jgi:pimeloyl-ACP methyl ester carboxylesterase
MSRLRQRGFSNVVSLLCCTTVWSACQPSAKQGATTVSTQSHPSPAEETLWLTANGLRLKSNIYRNARLSTQPVLIVVLHGDLLGVRAIPTATYHYAFAREAATKIDDVVVAPLLRPGYRDHIGEHSDGQQGLTTGDNYTAEVVDAVARAIDQLKAKFNPVRTVLAGHSGGAAITGNLLGRSPSTVDAALMVACPCDLVAWRKHMQRAQNNNPIWSAPVESLSPIDLAANVLPSVRVRLLVGADDPVTPAEMSERYAEALRAHGVNAMLAVVPGLQHDILLEPAALDALTSLVKTLRSR